MGRRGTKPKPEVLKLHGSKHVGDSPPPPRPPSVKPSCPSYLTEPARKIYRELANELHAMRVLARPDRHALALAAQSLADYIACRAFITQHGRVYPITNKAGAVVAFKPYPEVKLANQHLADFHKLAAKFGLTPSDRRSLAVETETASDSSRAKFFATA